MDEIDGRVLFTKDGRKIGNAIAKKSQSVDDMYIVTTDYGNKARLTTAEIHEWFYIGDKAEPDHKHYNG